MGGCLIVGREVPAQMLGGGAVSGEPPLITADDTTTTVDSTTAFTADQDTE